MPEPMVVRPISLQSAQVHLRVLGRTHAPDLLAAMDPDTFRYMPSGPATPDRAGVDGYIESMRSRPNHLAFAVIDPATVRAVGSTSYMNIRPEHRGLEIGCTWISADRRGTGLNTAMKRLMLAHAFEGLGALRVELRTDALNARSRGAIEKLGAEPEGILRRHMVMPDGRIRDTAVYAITDDRWPSIRGALARALPGTA